MTNIKAVVTGACITAHVRGPLTCGMVGVPVVFDFDETWDDLTKTAVFRAGNKTVDRVDIQTETTVPWEILESQNCVLFLGVYGADQQGTLVIPTVWAEISMIQPGTDPSGDESAAPSLPVWQQLVNKNHEQDRLLDALIRRLAGVTEVFIATYGETTFAQLEEAHAAGKLLYCNRDGRIYPMFDYRPGVDIDFNLSDSTTLYNNWCTVGDDWGYREIKHPGAHAASHGKNGTDPITPESIGAVSYTEQELTEEQQNQVRRNINAPSFDYVDDRAFDTMFDNSVSYTTKQALNVEQQAQARANIGALGNGDSPAFEQIGIYGADASNGDEMGTFLSPERYVQLDSGERYAALAFYGVIDDDKTLLRNIGKPIDRDDAANKEYVDHAVQGKPKELTQSWSELSAQIKKGDFTGINVGDYKPFKFLYSDEIGFISDARAYVMGIDTYYGVGNAGSKVGHHIDFLIVHPEIYGRMNDTNTNNGTAEENNPWRASAAYRALNGGSYWFEYGELGDNVPDSAENYIIDKVAQLDNRYSSAGPVSNTTGWNNNTFVSMGKFWIPNEVEVLGHRAQGEVGFPISGGGCNMQYPLFRNGLKHFCQNDIDTAYWLCSPKMNDSTAWCVVKSNGNATSYKAHSVLCYPMCFRIG